MTARDVGGGFGQKMFVFREECAVVLASRLLGRPVKWIEDRRENLIGAAHSRNEHGHVRDGAGRRRAHPGHHGRPRRRRRRLSALPRGHGPHAVARALPHSRGSASRRGWCGRTRWARAPIAGPWMFETTAREMAIDLAAREVGMDPIELRRRNLLVRRRPPLHVARREALQGDHSARDAGPGPEILDYDAFRAEQAAARAEGRLLGVGVSVYVEPTSMDAPTPRHGGGDGPRRAERQGRWPSSARRRTGRASRRPWRS